MEPERGDESSIESLKQKLYTPGEERVTELHRGQLHANEGDVAEDWQHEHVTPNSLMSLGKHHTKAKWFFGFAVVFFLIAAGAAFFFLTNNRNVISADKIDMAITGPVSISAGDTLALAIEVTNRNAATLEVADLIVEYPDGTRTAEDVTHELTDYRVGLGDIPSGGRVATSTKAILFGEEGTQHDIHVTLEYRIAGSNAIFVKESVYTVTVGSTPLSLSIDAPRSVNSGATVEFTLNIRSNAKVPLENVVLEAEYPFGFTFTSSDPETSYSDSLWALGDIQPEGKRQITVTGTLEGQQDEDRVFRFDLGVASQSDTTGVGTSFVRAEHEIQIDRPFIDLAFTTNGSKNDVVVATPGTIVRGNVSWRNNLPVKLADAVLEVELPGGAFDEGSVTVLNGFYDSGKNTIRWDKQDFADLAFINPGDSGEVSFSFTLRSANALAGTLVNPSIPMVARLTTRPVGESRTTDIVTGEDAQKIAVVSSAGLTSKTNYSSGPFSNSGPIPPVVEEKTTYTITWTLTNTTNDLTDGVVKAVLPQYVSWENETDPGNESITYNPSSREIVWKVGTLRAGSGYDEPARSVSFKIGLTPSVTHVGSAPVLVQNPIFFATDSFVGGEAGATSLNATTFLSDPSVPSNHDRVRQ